MPPPAPTASRLILACLCFLGATTLPVGCSPTDNRPIDTAQPTGSQTTDTGGKDTGTGIGTDTRGPPPWLDLATVPLQPLRHFLSTTLTDAVSPSRISALRDIPLTLVFDDKASTVWVLDSRYQHDPSTHCVDLTEWPDLDPEGVRVGSCHAGTAEVHRGNLDPSGGVQAVAADPSRPAVWLLLDSGNLALASADPTDNPLDLLRVVPYTGPVPIALGQARMVADGQGGVVVSDGAHVRWFNSDGQVRAEIDASSTELDFSDGQIWLLSDTMLSTWDGDALTTLAKVDGAGGRLADGWLSLPAQDALIDLSTMTEIQVKGLTGPLSSHSGRTWVAVSDGLALIEDGAETRRDEIDPVVDLVVQDTGELAVLHADGVVSVYGDETALGDNSPLKANIISYLENPKSGTLTDSPCKGGSSTLDAALQYAQKNRIMLDDLPAPTALGIIPAVADATVFCLRQTDLQAVWDGDRIATGLFFRADTEMKFPDTEELSDLLLGQAESHDTLDIPIRWTRGASRYDGDWVSALKATGLTDEILAPDLAAWPTVNATDPRSKDPLPWFASDARTAWRPTTATGITNDEGPLLRPGNSISLFDLSGCANMWIRECKQLDLGGIEQVRSADIDILALYLFRAIAVRSASGPDHWSFHLPAIGAYDYTEDCTVVDRRWSGDDCQAQLIQDFLLDVQARYVSADLVSWWLPE